MPRGSYQIGRLSSRRQGQHSYAWLRIPELLRGLGQCALGIKPTVATLCSRIATQVEAGALLLESTLGFEDLAITLSLGRAIDSISRCRTLRVFRDHGQDTTPKPNKAPYLLKYMETHHTSVRTGGKSNVMHHSQAEQMRDNATSELVP